jgi:hypothetical protein
MKFFNVERLLSPWLPFTWDSSPSAAAFSELLMPVSNSNKLELE